MFTGIITDTTKVIDSQREDDGLTITFARPAGWDEFEAGESINTDGVCLTVAELDDDSYTCHLVPETLHKTTFGQHLHKEVNLERAVRASDRMSGHLVQGHVDDTGQVVEVAQTSDYRISIKFDPKYSDLVVDKGSVTIQGVSLTVARVEDTVCSVALVPYTLSHTTLGSLNVGDKVNLEFDLIGKYIVKALKTHANR